MHYGRIIRKIKSIIAKSWFFVKNYGGKGGSEVSPRGAREGKGPDLLIKDI